MKTKVIFRHVSKTYKLYTKSSDKILDLFSIKKKRTKTFYALYDISFEVFEGETIGIIGTNGSGKSTLSNLLSESVPHSSGTIKINGEPSLIAIAAGLDKNLSGIDNIEQKCLMHGMKRKEIENVRNDIIEFADLGDFINQPVKNYSSGMKSRLGFAISVHTNPDILIIDEALSVGDQTFYQKCLDKIDEFKNEGKTIFFVSHSISQMKSISDRVMWIQYGRIKELGDAKTVLKNYSDFIKWYNSLKDDEQKKFKAEMVEKQTTVGQREADIQDASRLSRLNKNEKPQRKGRLGFLLQLASLLTITALSAFLMFNSPKNVDSVKENDEPQANEAMNKDAIETFSVNKEGIVISNHASVYSSLDKSSSNHTLPFSETVYVEQEEKDMYKVNIDEQILYINKNDIKLTSKNDIKKTDGTIEQYSLLLPESFYQSYEFFLAFLNSDYDTVKSKLTGYNESTNEFGNKILLLNDYGISYIFNAEEIATEILIEDVEQETDASDLFISQSQLASTDQKHFLQITESHEFILNLNEETFSIRTK